MSELHLICKKNELEDPGSRGFSLEINGHKTEGFVVQKDGLFFCYQNTCPHTGAPLDWVEHQFLDPDNSFIQCAVHDARFEIENGLCIAGPCPGKKLKKINVVNKDDALYLEA